jgi:hypothetical protein
MTTNEPVRRDARHCPTWLARGPSTDDRTPVVLESDEAGAVGGWPW